MPRDYEPHHPAPGVVVFLARASSPPPARVVRGFARMPPPEMVGDIGLIGGGECASSEEVEAAYGDWAERYATTIRQWGYDCPERAARLLASALAANPPPRRGLRILDAGCGDGLQASSLRRLHLLRDDAELVGLDISRPLLRLAHQKAAYTALVHVDLNRPDALASFPDDRFDAILCVGVLTYLHRTALLDAFARLLRVDVVVVFTSRQDRAAPWEARARALEAEGRWSLVRKTDPLPYVPGNPAYGDRVLVRLYVYRRRE